MLLFPEQPEDRLSVSLHFGLDALQEDRNFRDVPYSAPKARRSLSAAEKAG